MPHGMKNLDSKSSEELLPSLEYSANTPLWSRVPTKDENGVYLGDFMMVITGLKKASSEHRKKTINSITQVLAKYSDVVVFADLNMKMSLLCTGILFWLRSLWGYYQGNWQKK